MEHFKLYFFHASTTYIKVTNLYCIKVTLKYYCMYFFAFRYNFRIRSLLMAENSGNNFHQIDFPSKQILFLFFLEKKTQIEAEFGFKSDKFRRMELSFEVSWWIIKSFRFFKSWKIKRWFGEARFFWKFFEVCAFCFEIFGNFFQSRLLQRMALFIARHPESLLKAFSNIFQLKNYFFSGTEVSSERNTFFYHSECYFVYQSPTTL